MCVVSSTFIQSGVLFIPNSIGSMGTKPNYQRRTTAAKLRPSSRLRAEYSQAATQRDRRRTSIHSSLCALREEKHIVTSGHSEFEATASLCGRKRPVFTHAVTRQVADPPGGNRFPGWPPTVILRVPGDVRAHDVAVILVKLLFKHMNPAPRG